MLIKLRLLLLALVLALVAGLSHANTQLVILSGESRTAYSSATNALIQELVNDGVSRDAIATLTLAEWSAKRGAMSPKVFVALGSQATTLLVEENPGAPVLAALIPRQSFERILRQSGRQVSPQLTAIYLDQPLSRQLALIRAALPSAKRVGVLWGPESKGSATQLRALVETSGMQLVEAEFKSDSTGFPEMRQTLSVSDVFLALADPSVFNSNSIQNLLLSAFRANVPMVAFSPAYVRAGAWLSLQVTPNQIGQQLAPLIYGVMQGGALPDHTLESSDFEVSVNEHVGRSLNLKADPAELRLHLRRLEQLP
jgi:ABC-type uncharacterized transport system substrate-binding protein